MSTRIAWLNCLSALQLGLKFLVVLALLGALAYGIRSAIEHTFHKNSDFQLQTIKLNENEVLDEADLVDFLGIDLSSNIFEFDVEQMEQTLASIPAISQAKVKRDYPHTLVFELQTRKPIAWIACPSQNFPALRAPGALLVDETGFLYPCPTRQFEHATHLPIISLNASEDQKLELGKAIDHPEFKQCKHLLEAIVERDSSRISTYHSISQRNSWSLNLKTRSGVLATVGLGDHQRQLANFDRALEHAKKKGYQIKTINLIPERNVPITVVEDMIPPRAVPVQIEEPVPAPPKSRQSQDLQSLLNRN